MNPLHEELRTLEDEARALLRKHDDSDPGFLVDATLLVLPSFEDCWAYSILRSVRDSEAPAKGSASRLEEDRRSA